MRPGPARQVSCADVERAAQPLPLDPLVEAIATGLATHAEFVGLVHQDLVRGLTQAGTGRTGLSAVQTLRAFALQRINHWDLRELRARIADGLTLRPFTTFDCQAVPSHTACHRAVTRLPPITVRALNDAGARAAITLGLDDGTRLWVDTTVVETDTSTSPPTARCCGTVSACSRAWSAGSACCCPRRRRGSSITPAGPAAGCRRSVA